MNTRAEAKINVVIGAVYPQNSAHATNYQTEVALLGLEHPLPSMVFQTCS
tara:strand:+ start:16745 stop:16894 length:150 start_codon:yes stop_codon:yes gene_type:complete